MLPPLAGHEPGNLVLRPFKRMCSFDCVAPAMSWLGVRPGVWISASCDWDDLIYYKAPRIWIFESQIDWFTADSACSPAFDCCFVPGDELVPSSSVLSANVRLMRCHSFIDSVQIQSMASIRFNRQLRFRDVAEPPRSRPRRFADPTLPKHPPG